METRQSENGWQNCALLKGSRPIPANAKWSSSVFIPGVIVLLWGLFQITRHPEFFWNDDFQAQASPFFEEIVRSWREGEIPLLSRNSWSTGNIAGEFQFGGFSPSLNLLLQVVWMFPLSLPGKAAAVAIAHLIWLATGVFMLGRQRGLPAPLATAAALATSLSGWVIAWGATNWISFLMGFSWVPWAWWAMQASIAGPTVWIRWLRPGIFVGLLILAGNTFAIVMLPVIGLWLVLQAGLRDRNWRALGPMAVAGILGAGLSAPAWWLLLEAAARSPRWGWGLAVQTAWIVPWRAWPALVLPSFVTPWPYYSSEYFPHTSVELACGLVPVAALFAAILFRPKDALRTLHWDLLLLLISLLMVSLPTLGQFRWSFRWLPLFHLVLALAGTTALQRGLAARAPVCGVGLIVAVWSGSAVFGQNRSPALAAWILGLAAAWWLVQRFAPKRCADWMPAAVIALSLGATFHFIPTQDSSFQAKFRFDDRILSPAPLDRDRLYLSLYSFKEVVEGETRPKGYGTILRPVNAMHYAGLRFLNGYSSYPGREVQALFDPHGDMPAERAESLAGPDGERLLLFLGVDGMVFSTEYAPFAEDLGPEWIKVAEGAEGVAYHREPRRFAPVKVLRFLFDRPDVTLAQPSVRLVSERRNSVKVEILPQSEVVQEDLGDNHAGGPTVAPIAFVRPFVPGYEAWFNGTPVPVREYRGILPVVELPGDARGVLELRYRPRGWTVGILIVLATALIMLVLAMVGRRPSAA